MRGLADEALDVLAEQLPAVAVCDVRMPGRDGVWLAERIRRDYLLKPFVSALLEVLGECAGPP